MHFINKNTISANIPFSEFMGHFVLVLKIYRPMLKFLDQMLFERTVA